MREEYVEIFKILETKIGNEYKVDLGSNFILVTNIKSRKENEYIFNIIEDMCSVYLNENEEFLIVNDEESLKLEF